MEGEEWKWRGGRGSFAAITKIQNEAPLSDAQSGDDHLAPI